jgi:tetratricopeptide (TPR) repeat protein
MSIIQKKSALIVLLIGTIILLLPDSARPAAGQDTDPFYRKTLENGETSYLAKSYEEAVRNLEIAVFGLAKEKTLQARGYVFLALSRAALQQKDLSAENLTSAITLIGGDELRAMNLPESVKAELEKLLASSSGHDSGPHPVSPPPPQKKEIETLPIVQPQPESPAPVPKTAPAISRVDRLREAMKTNPRDPLSYYELASHYRENEDIADARKTLETLLARNPAEIRGYLEIGRLEYAARNLKAAEKSLEKFLALTASVRIEDRLRDEGRALLLLSAWLRGDAKKTAKLFALSEDLFQAGRWDDLSLDAPDKERLRALRGSLKK